MFVCLKEKQRDLAKMSLVQLLCLYIFLTLHECCQSNYSDDVYIFLGTRYNVSTFNHIICSSVSSLSLNESISALDTFVTLIESIPVSMFRCLGERLVLTAIFQLFDLLALVLRDQSSSYSFSAHRMRARVKCVQPLVFLDFLAIHPSKIGIII